MKNVHEITVKIEGKEWEEALNKSFKKNVKNVKVDGFRKGSVPKKVYVKKYGIESLFMDAVNEAMPNAYTKIEEQNLKPIIQPKVDIKHIDDLELELVFTVTEAPEIKIKKYKDLKVKKEKFEVTKKDVEDEIEKLRKQYAEIVLKDGKVENGNTAIIDFEGFKDGVPFEGGKGENFPLEIGSNTFIPGFEEQLIGMEKETNKDITVKFPEDYPADNLKGAEVVFKVHLHEIKTKEIPELNEEFILDLAMDGVNTKEELFNRVEKNLTEAKDLECENKRVDLILEEINKNVEVEVPQELIEDEIQRMLSNYEERLKMQGISLDQYLEFTKMTMDKLKEQLTPEAEKSVRYRLFLNEIIEIENITVTPKEVDDELENMVKMYQMPKEDIKQAMGGFEHLEGELRYRKVINFLKENN